MKSSVDLDCEYLKLGRLKKAGGIFNRILDLSKTGSVTVESKILFLLRRTESLAAMGDVVQRYPLVFGF